MFGHLPAILLHAIRTGSWLAREALTDARDLRRYAAACCGIAVALSLAPSAAHAARGTHTSHGVRPHLPGARPVPYPRLPWPLPTADTHSVPSPWPDLP